MNSQNQSHACKLVVALMAFSLHSCTSHDPNQSKRDEELAVLVDGSGTYSRAISTDSQQAQLFFDQGLRLTWGYFFPESIASHQEALRHDPGHPMIYWGMALAMGPNPNSRYSGMPDDPHGEAKKAISQAVKLMDHANDSERDFIETLSVRFDSETFPVRSDRDRAYLDAARELYGKYPTDPDAAALYADAYMVIGQWDYWDKEGRPRDGTNEVASALEDILKLRPDHPGANHLNIHLLEASWHPEKALASADRLEALMPNAGHIVHMPAHIYVRVGQYKKAIAINERSLEADKKFLAIWGDRPFPNIGTYPLSARIHGPHALEFIRYAATVQGNYARAIDAAQRSSAGMKGEAERSSRGQKRKAAVWMVQKIFAQWDELLNNTPPSEGFPYLDGLHAYTRGSAKTGTGDLDGAKRELEKLKRMIQDPQIDAARIGVAPVSAVLSLAIAGLDGEIKQSEGDLDGAIIAFEAAVELEDTFRYIEPPEWAQPMRHYLGAALLEAKRPIEAESVYRRDLRWNQNNGWALFGLSQSLSAQGKGAEAQSTLARFQATWQDADIELTRSRL